MKNYKELETSITHLGEKGDGIALTTEGQVFVPMTLPGEKVRIRIETSAKKGRKIDLLEIIEESKEIFKKNKVFKPGASRKDSKESFIVCSMLR